MSKPRHVGEWPLGLFPDTAEGQVARAAGEMAFVVRALRRRAEWSQDALAARAGVTRQTISSFERGEILPQLESVLRLLVALGQAPRLDVFSRLVEDPVLYELGTRPED